MFDQPHKNTIFFKYPLADAERIMIYYMALERSGVAQW